MKIFVAFVMGWMVATIGGQVIEHCCEEKEVGGVRYRLVETDPSATQPPHNCTSQCVYSTTGGGRFCFRAGGQQSKCLSSPASITNEPTDTSTTTSSTVLISTSIKVTTTANKNAVLLIGGLVNFTESYNNDVNVELLGSCADDIGNLTKDLSYRIWSPAADVIDQRLYICGGFRPRDIPSSDCFIREIGSPEKLGPSLNVGRGYHTLNTVGTHLVVAGGQNKKVGYLNSIELLEPGADAWILQNYTLTSSRYSHCAVTTSSKSIMFIGGGYNPELHQKDPRIKTTEELDILTGSITKYADLPVRTVDHACSLYNGRILVTGGLLITGITHSVYSLDISLLSNEWVTEPSMKSARYSHAMQVVNGVPTVYSGMATNFGNFKMEEFADGEWKETPFKTNRYRSASVAISC